MIIHDYLSPLLNSFANPQNIELNFEHNSIMTIDKTTRKRLRCHRSDQLQIYVNFVIYYAQKEIVFIIKNGYRGLVVMKMEICESMLELWKQMLLS